MNSCCHIIVKGRVQGVGFRWFVETEVRKFGLHGYVKNRPDGDVETEVEGEREIIEAFIAQLKLGNRISRVDHVVLDWSDCQGKYRDFQIRF
ncbi:MAG: acylphosphatase [Candidatus Zhuqueibacterota bacterium]